MADFVYVTSQTTGLEVAAQTIGTVAYQVVKVAQGASGTTGMIDATTNAQPGAGSMGLVVAVLPGASVSALVSGTITVAGTISVSNVVSVTGALISVLSTGTISVSGVVLASITASATIGTIIAVSGITAVSNVSTLVTLLGTVNVNLAAAGTTIPVNIVAGGAAPGTTFTGQTSNTAQLVWLAQTQTLSLVSTVVTILGTQIVTIAQTSVIAAISSIVPVTTAASVSVSGLPVWLNPTQGVNVSTVSGTININLAAAGTTIPVNIVAGGAAPGTTFTGQTSNTAQLVWLAQTQTLSLVSTVATVLGTVNINLAAAGTTIPVNVVAGGAAPGTTFTGQTSNTAQLVWLAQTQTLSLVSTVATVVTVLSTVNVAIVAGAGGGGSVTTAVPSISATGQIVFIVGGQSTTANPVFVSGTVASVLGTVLVSVAASATVGTIIAVSGITAVSNLSTVVTLLGTVLVSITPGSTTGSSGMSGVLVWLGASQTMLVTIAGGAAGGGSVTTAGPSVSATGQVVWLAGGQSAITNPVYISGTIQNVASLSTILGTAVVSVVPGVSVLASITVSATVGTIIAVSGVTAVSNLSTLVTLLGTVNVNIAAGAGGVTTAVPSISATGQVMWIAGGQSTTAAPVYIQVSGALVGSTTQAAITGAVVWLAPTQSISVISTVATVLGTVNVSVIGALAGGYWMAAATSTALSSSTQVMLMSVYNSTGSTLGTSGWTIGAGSVLVVYGLGVGWSQAAANMQVTFMLAVTNTGATLSTVVTAWAQVTFSTAAALSTFISTGWTPGGVVGINSSIVGIQFPFVIPGPAVVGLVVAATSSGATVYGSILGSIVNTIPVVQVITGTVSLPAAIITTGLPSISAQGIAVYNVGMSVSTTQAAATGPINWLAPTQTISLVSTVVTILGTVTVSNVSVAGAIGTTALATGVSTGLIVIPKDFARAPVVIMISSTIVGSSTTMLFTIYTNNTSVAAGTSAWAVPAGKVLRINGINVIGVSSAVLGQAQFVILVATATASLSVTATVGLAAALPYAIQASTAAYSIGYLMADISAGTTICPGIVLGTSHSIIGAIIQGVLY